MGEYEVFYKSKEKDKFAKQVADNVFQYNIRVDIIQPLIKKMLLRLERQEPEECDWLVQDGEDRVAFKVYDGGALKHPLYLIPDLSCSLAFGAENKKDGSMIFKGVVYIKHIDENDILAQPDCTANYDDVHAEPERYVIRQPSLVTITMLCNEMLEIAREKFKVSKKDLIILKSKLR